MATTCRVSNPGGWLDPEFFFSTQKQKLICIDEIQIGPELFPIIRVMVDEDRRPGKFLILGSASQDVIRNCSETLAGRIHFIELAPFTYDELILDAPLQFAEPTLPWTRGGFPDSLLAASDDISYQWREDFIRTFIERDIPQFGFSIPAITLRRFWTMLAHFHAQPVNLCTHTNTARPAGTPNSPAKRWSTSAMDYQACAGGTLLVHPHACS